MRLADRLWRRAHREMVIALQFFRIAFYRLISTGIVSGKPRRIQPLHVAGLGRVTFGKNVSIGVFPSPFFFSTAAYFEARNPAATIMVGEGTWINNNFRAIVEHSSIKIGRNCLIGANVEILDSDFHGLAVADRRKSLQIWARPVNVGDDVFIGSNVVILKGVSIGDGSVIANGAVVSKDVPAGVVAAGNPARILRPV